MKWKYVFSSLLILSLLGVFFYFFNTSLQKASEVHWHAGFQVYKDDKLVDFSDLKYMHIKPCVDKKTEEHEDEQIEKAHLHEGVGDVVHVHRDSAKWIDLFKNIQYNVSATAVVYTNGKKTAAGLQEKIHAYDSAVFIIGKTGDIEDKLKKAVTKKHIQEAEQRTESC